MKCHHARFLPLALFALLSAPLAAHPLDEANIWVYETPQARPAAPVAKIRRVAEPPAPGDAAASFIDGNATWSISLGYRRETIDYNIAGAGGVPNIVSELKWKTDMAELRVDFDWEGDEGFVAEMDLAHATAFDGRNRDSDYLYDNRRGEFSRSYAKVDGSSATRLSAGVGWRFDPFARVSFKPMLGYAYQEHDMRMRHGVLVIDTVYGDLGRFHGLDSHYRPSWRGPWLGLRIDAQPTERFAFNISAKRQWFKLRADSTWNLRGDLAQPTTHRQKGDSYGWQLGMGAAWWLTPERALTLRLDQQMLRLRRGDRYYYPASGGRGRTDLNEVNLDSWSAAVGYQQRF
ncbi:MAG: hypothetical protein LBI92_03300 [Azoarcus sp.]|jgi:hypothetical protein|nr:hypothetical protein [Azoarcus sp.]